ncbi:hypothetical protein CkaCkLH20_04186 [Colletotrichum karsti]|uniref:Oxidoreductase n=1 Tax=Colletotrichum karsti TaxID=1095194 RepID=A0A9P6I865_9PEZI|nr:uncharacterized protein CkaCkLH20_04186 [Colletotrichum karsti]KAF9878148.1 hypothetical protein CkaCkLH20_04186 [Colletotrichum karsti]
MKGRVFIVTGGAQGLGLSLAEALVEAGGKVYCLDQQESPHEDFAKAMERVVPEWGGTLRYRQANVVDTDGLDEVISGIALKNERLDGVIAAAGINQITPAIDYTVEDINKMMAVNYTGVFMTAQSAARQMIKYKCHGSICLIASMSGFVANHGMLSPVYNSSKAAVIQLARNLAMEWSPMRKDGSGGIRVNCISPGHIMTPMVEQNFKEVPGLREEWEGHNMFGRLADTTEFKGAGLFLMSNASTFMTGSFYYGGYGLLLLPSMGIADAYGGKTTEYYNAFGFYLVVWSIFNLFFFIASFATNVANIVVYGGLEFSYILNCSANFAMADDHAALGITLTKVAGAFGFISALTGFYTLAHELCSEVLPFEIPLGDTSRFFQKADPHAHRN